MKALIITLFVTAFSFAASLGDTVSRIPSTVKQDSLAVNIYIYAYDDSTGKSAVLINDVMHIVTPDSNVILNSAHGFRDSLTVFVDTVGSLSYLFWHNGQTKISDFAIDSVLWNERFFSWDGTSEIPIKEHATNYVDIRLEPLPSDNDSIHGESIISPLLSSRVRNIVVEEEYSGFSVAVGDTLIAFNGDLHCVFTDKMFGRKEDGQVVGITTVKVLEVDQALPVEGNVNYRNLMKNASTTLYNLKGQKIAKFNAGEFNSTALQNLRLPRGVYLLKAGEVSRAVQVR